MTVNSKIFRVKVVEHKTDSRREKYWRNIALETPGDFD
jgi:hypothetical protein